MYSTVCIQEVQYLYLNAICSKPTVQSPLLRGLSPHRLVTQIPTLLHNAVLLNKLNHQFNTKKLHGHLSLGDGVIPKG